MSHSPASLADAFARPYLSPNSGAVVALVEADKVNVFPCGALRTASQCPASEILFEIGSITKVFASILLARLHIEGVIDMDKPVGDLCRSFAGLPSWITPRSLATHRSGLPRLPVSAWTYLFRPVPEDPYAAFATDDLIGWMKGWRPPRPPLLSAHLYSNLGVGLLGTCMAFVTETSFETLLRQRVLQPLGLSQTAITLSDSQALCFAQPRAANGKDVLPWTFQALAAAGALRASAGDLARFAQIVAAARQDRSDLLMQAIGMTMEPQLGLGPSGPNSPMQQCLGWFNMQLVRDGAPILFHDGGTAGSSSALYVGPDQHRAVIILANCGKAAGFWSNLKLMRANLNRLAHDYITARETQGGQASAEVSSG